MEMGEKRHSRGSIGSTGISGDGLHGSVEVGGVGLRLSDGFGDLITKSGNITIIGNRYHI